MRFKEFSEMSQAEFDKDPAVRFYRMMSNPISYGLDLLGGNKPADNAPSDTAVPQGSPMFRSTQVSGKEPAFREPGFKAALEKTASNLGVNPNDLLQIMKRESGVDPHRVNPRGGATGLIQFVPKTARDLGTTTYALGRMSAVEQMAYVEKYYKNLGVKPGATLDDLYMYTFYPKAVGKKDSDVVLRRGQDGYANNARLDQNKDGIITVADVKNFLHGRS